MKTLKLFSMLFIASALSLGFVSCGSDDDENPTPVTPTPTEDDDPTPSTKDYSSLIVGNWMELTDISSSKQAEVLLGFGDDGVAGFQDLMNEDNINYGIVASGTYTLSGNTITAYYNDVFVSKKDWSLGTYHGFTHGENKTVKYTIVSCDGKKMTVTDDSGNTFNMTKYID